MKVTATMPNFDSLEKKMKVVDVRKIFTAKRTETLLTKTYANRVKGVSHNTKWHKAKHSTVKGLALVKLFLAYCGQCVFCENQFPLESVKVWTVEHIIPQSWFAANNLKRDSTIKNTAIACKGCNAKQANGGKYTKEQKERVKQAQVNYTQLTDGEIQRITFLWAMESKNFAKDVLSPLRKTGKLAEVKKMHGID